MMTLRQIEVIRAGLVVDREVIPQALTLNSPLFATVYTEMLNAKKTAKTVQAALDVVDAYMAQHSATLFAPPWLMHANEFAIQRARAKRHIRLVAENGLEQFWRFRDRRREIGVGKERDFATRGEQSKTHRSSFSEI